MTVLTIILTMFTVAYAADEGANQAVFSAWKELERLGKITEENGVPIAMVTMPAEFSEGATQEIIDASAGRDYISGTVNPDGSVTYKLNEEQHKAMSDGIAEVIEGAIWQIVGSADFGYAAIRHSDDYRDFSVYMNSEELGQKDIVSAKTLYMLGGLYGVFTGHADDNVAVHYYDVNGNLLGTGNSEKNK